MYEMSGVSERMRQVERCSSLVEDRAALPRRRGHGRSGLLDPRVHFCSFILERNIATTFHGCHWKWACTANSRTNRGTAMNKSSRSPRPLGSLPAAAKTSLDINSLAQSWHIAVEGIPVEGPRRRPSIPRIRNTVILSARHGAYDKCVRYGASAARSGQRQHQ
jgi:hypothetical protein